LHSAPPRENACRGVLTLPAQGRGAGRAGAGPRGPGRAGARRELRDTSARGRGFGVGAGGAGAAQRLRDGQLQRLDGRGAAARAGRGRGRCRRAAARRLSHPRAPAARPPRVQVHGRRRLALRRPLPPLHQRQPGEQLPRRLTQARLCCAIETSHLADP